MRWSVPGAIAAVGYALVLVGVVVFEIARGATADFGWTAYTPLPSEAPLGDLTLGSPDGWAVIWNGTQVLGAVVVVVGLLVLTAVASWLLGHRGAGER